MPERTVEILLQLAFEILGCPASSFSARAVGIDQTMELLSVGQRQEGERAVAEKTLPGGMLMWPRGAHHGHDGRLAIVGARGEHARQLAHARLRAVRAHHQPRAQVASAGVQHRAVAVLRERSSLACSSAMPARRAAAASAACSTLFSAITPRSRSPISAASNTSASPPCGGTSACHTCMRS